MKTFEEKKQELLNEIFNYTGGTTREIFTNMVNELVPPNPLHVRLVNIYLMMVFTIMNVMQLKKCVHLRYVGKLYNRY